MRVRQLLFPARRFRPSLGLVLCFFAAALWMQNDLRPPVLARIKLLIRLRRFVQAKLVRYNPGRLCPVVMNEMAKIAVVSFDVRLARSHVQAFLEELADVEG